MNTLTEQNIAELEKTAAAARKREPIRVCFVCTGNTCRSPMAEALLNDMGRPREVCSMCAESVLDRREYRASSAGLSASFGAPISQNAVLALEHAGIRATAANNYPLHRSKQVDETDMLLNDVIVGISSAHAMALVGAFPQYASKIISMSEDIPDPFGGSEEDYINCLEVISSCIRKMFFGTDRMI